MLLAVRISSYGCTWEVWRALKKLELLSAAPRATLTHFSCSPNFPRASITRYTNAKHEQIICAGISLQTLSVPKLKVFREWNSKKTVSFEEQIMSMDKFTSIFFRQVEAIDVYYPSNICKARETELLMNSLPFVEWDVQCSLVEFYQQTNISFLL